VALTDELALDLRSVDGRRSLGTEAAAILREAILDGRLPQGERVNEVDLSRRLGISRGPLREALHQLEHEGLVESSPYKGRSIVRVSAREVLDVLTVRKLLEPYAVQEAMGRNRRELVELLAKAMLDMQVAAKAGNPFEVASAHGRFHGAFYHDSGNSTLERMWGRLEDPVRLYLLRRQTTFGDMANIADAHRRMIHLLDEGNRSGLKAEVTAHVDLNLKTIRRLMKGSQGSGDDGS
jgi:DNA-binding GntR family transcriptional regulator